MHQKEASHRSANIACVRWASPSMSGSMIHSCLMIVFTGLSGIPKVCSGNPRGQNLFIEA